MSEELLTAQLSIVVLTNHHTPQLLRLLTVASPSGDDKSYRGMLHRQTFSDLCWHRKKRTKAIAAFRSRRQNTESKAGFFKNKRPKWARQPHSGVYLENRDLGNCFQWTEVSNYPWTSARVPIIEAAYGTMCFYSGPDKFNACNPPPPHSPPEEATLGNQWDYVCLS